MPKEVIEIRDNKGMNIQSTSIEYPATMLNVRVDIKGAFVPETESKDSGGRSYFIAEIVVEREIGTPK